MKVQFDVSEIERKTYTVELPDDMDVSGWTLEQMAALGEAVYSAYWHQTDALDRLAADWKFVRVTDSETDHSIDGFYFETNGSSTKGRF